jgi:hypothetical protein
MTNFSELFRKYNPLKEGLGELDTIVDERAKAIQSGILYERDRIRRGVQALDVDYFDDICHKDDVLKVIDND